MGDSKYSILSDKSILSYLEQGRVIIEPFNRKHLNTSSYDVTLGEYYFREQPLEHHDTHIYNIYDNESVKKIWGQPQMAMKYKDYKDQGVILDNFEDDDRIIWIGPNERILAHTNEYIGGVESVTTMMKSRSSIGRNFLDMCSDAGWGDVGYFNRWTMEIHNNSMTRSIPLKVGTRVAQIIFMETDGIVDNSYNDIGKYQSKGKTLKELQENWSPEDLLPRIYMDKY